MNHVLVKKILPLATALVLISSTASAGKYNHHSKKHYSNTYYDYARVVNVEPIYKQVKYYEPQEECYYERRKARGRHNTTAVIVGSLLGGALGNELGHNKSNKRVGAIAGAILGGSIANDVTRGKSTYHHQHEQVCTTTQQVRYHEKVTGYNVGYKYRGKTYYTHTRRHPGDEIKIAVDIRPVI